MNADSEKLCLEELDHLILDNDKKVTVTYISNNFNVPNKDSETVLGKWIKNYSGDKKIAKEYLIRGTDLNGNSIITVVNEKSLPKVNKVCPNHKKLLYSVEVSSINGKSLNVQEPTTSKFIGLKIESDKRNIKVNQIVIPPTEKSIKKEPAPAKKPSNLFGTVQSKPQPKDVKAGKDSGSHSKDVTVKEEKKSPTKSSPKKGQPAKATKAPQGKSSIASFFAKPSTSSTSTASKVNKSVFEAAAKIESVKIKDEPVETTVNDSKNAIKRPHSNASDSNEDSKSVVKNEKGQAKKKMKLEPKSARSRLMQICDSSSDEEDTSERKDTPMDTEEEKVVVKKEKENKTPSPDKSKVNKSNGSTDSKKRRAKMKKVVTKTYEDDDGFINTVHETVEVSCSDEEPEVAEPPPKKPVQNPIKSTSTTSKKKVSPPDGKKQGSILSFFGKK